MKIGNSLTERERMSQRAGRSGIAVVRIQVAVLATALLGLLQTTPVSAQSLDTTQLAQAATGGTTTTAATSYSGKAGSVEVGPVWRAVGDRFPAYETEFDVGYTRDEITADGAAELSAASKRVLDAVAAKRTKAGGGSTCIEYSGRRLCYVVGPPSPWREVVRKVGAKQVRVLPLAGGGAIEIVSDDLTGPGLARLQRKAKRISGGPAWYVCRARVEGGAVIPGVVERQTCIFTLKGRKETRHRNYELLHQGVALEWLPGGRGYLPADAIPVGEGSGYRLYTCRAMVTRLTRIGWTVDGRYCHVTDFARHEAVENFQVLAVDRTATPEKLAAGGYAGSPKPRRCPRAAVFFGPYRC